MSGGFKNLLRRAAPAGVRRWWNNRHRWQWLSGDYASWAEAQKDATHSDGAAELARVCAAAREVIAGRAAWDRDGVAFAEPAVHEPLLAALRHAAAAHDNRLRVLDFGGGLGCAWRQHRAALGDLREVHWRIVETPPVVAAGGQEFADGVLSFHSSVDEAERAGRADVLLLSSVLAYLERPHELLANLAQRDFGDVIIDRTPLVAGSRDRLAVQRTPPELGGGSHPCWLFARDGLLRVLAPQYDLVAEWAVPFDRIDDAVEHRGFHFRRRDVAPGGARP